jgi:type II secretion system protein G
MKKGFTLIELLLVIAILGALAAATVMAINPTRRINQANDTKGKNDISQISTALNAYFTSNSTYPTTAQGIAILDDTGVEELTAVPTAMTGYTYTYTACATAPCTATSLYTTLLAPKVSTTPIWCWRSATGVTQEVINAAACAP